MRRERPKKWPTFLAVILLGVVMFENLGRPKSADAEPYHQMLIDYYKSEKGVPRRINQWVNKEDIESSKEAISLLKPNVLFSRVYMHELTGDTVTLLLAQCKDARDIYGHYPPICYPNSGKPQVVRINAAGKEEKKVDLIKMKIGDVEVPITRYYFKDNNKGGVMVVDNFIIYPPRKMQVDDSNEWQFEHGKYQPNMNEFYTLVGDYTRRFYGGSQVQLIYDKGIKPEAYDALFEEIIGGIKPFIETIRRGDKQQ